MEKRFTVVSNSTAPVLWEDVFDEDHQMTGRQPKYNYMRDRTFLRPRDMIKFCNETLAAFKLAPTAKKFENKHILDAQPAYSHYLYNELEDEIHKHLPNYEFYVEVLRNLEALQFTREDFLQAWDKRKSLLYGEDNPDNAMKQLFEFSVIGYYSLGGGGGGAEYVWKYRNAKNTFNENASQFRVHSGFKDVMGLKKSRGLNRFRHQTFSVPLGEWIKADQSRRTTPQGLSLFRIQPGGTRTPTKSSRLGAWRSMKRRKRKVLNYRQSSAHFKSISNLKKNA